MWTYAMWRYTMWNLCSNGEALVECMSKYAPMGRVWAASFGLCIITFCSGALTWRECRDQCSCLLYSRFLCRSRFTLSFQANALLKHWIGLTCTWGHGWPNVLQVLVKACSHGGPHYCTFATFNEEQRMSRRASDAQPEPKRLTIGITHLCGGLSSRGEHKHCSQCSPGTVL